MEFITYSYRYAGSILENELEFEELYSEIREIIHSINDKDIIEEFNYENKRRSIKSISSTINTLLFERFVEKNWEPESQIFQDNHYSGDTWRLDFAKDSISVEVAFNHASVIAWNLLKPVLASELNHVEKAIQTKVGVIITATENLKKKGNFDSAIGTFEKFVKFLSPLNNQLTVPILLIGLEQPETFFIEQYLDDKNRNKGRIVFYE
jgi:hypothetical protein